MQRCAAVPRLRRPRGVVLLVVTMVVAMLTLAGLSFVAMLATENKAVRLHGQQIQLAAVVESGEEFLAVVAEAPPEERERFGGIYDNAGRFRDVLVLDDPDARFSIIAPRVENDEVMGTRYGAENESARLNLAVLLEWERQQEGAAQEALLSLPGMTEATSDAILDWIDPDDEPRPMGAEAGEYASMQMPYAPRNAVPTSLEELLLVKGVTRQLMFGGDENFNHRLDAGELGTAGAGSIGFAGAGLSWASLLTVHSAERNLDRQGNPRIDLNGDDLQQLHQSLSEVFDRRTADFVVLYRQFGPYEEDTAAESAASPDASRDQSSGATEIPGPRSRPALQPRRAESPIAPSSGGSARIDFDRPAAFSLSSPLDLVGAAVRMPESAGGKQEVVQSPLENDPASMRTYLPRLIDGTTTETAEVLRGRINVNAAPRAVLAAVPGIDAALAERIVAARPSPGARLGEQYSHPGWLLSEGLVDLEQMKALRPFLTTGGDVYRAQIVGRFEDQGPPARVEVVLDATRRPPRRVYWKDLRLLGPGY